MNDKKYILNDIIPYLMLIIALLTLLFGDSIISKVFSNKANLVLETELINEFIPEEIANNKIFKDNNLNKGSSLRIIRIKNEGKSTKNLRIQLNLDGRIYFNDINSTEKITNKKIESDSTIILSLDRLSHNSTIDIKVWLENEQKQFDVSYTDDVSNSTIREKSQSETIYKTILYTLLTLILLLSLILIIFNFSKRRNAKRSLEQQDLLENILKQVSESHFKEESEDESPTTVNDRNNSLDRLRDLINKNRE
ncbi:hypothetical protein ACA30_21385 [Virgibacillus soli]|uniref:hypothetical protein n=1 Tax=Virgibacillus sp. MG-45 TaxID=3102791 RepID=UPI000712C1C3|nr:hypothetical protein ACA30_21385 [Virgibacillus soli]